MNQHCGLSLKITFAIVWISLHLVIIKYNVNALIYCGFYQGLWLEHDCESKTAGVDKTKAKRLYNLACPDLDHLPEKSLYLRDHNWIFLAGTQAVYECSLGKYISGQETNVTLTCQSDGTWSQAIEDLPSCEPKTCNAQTLDLPVGSGWTMTENILLDQRLTFDGTAMTFSCPEDKYFYEDISYFEALCETNGYRSLFSTKVGCFLSNFYSSNWTVSHSVGCQGFSSQWYNVSLLNENDTCEDIALDLMTCLYPLCPYINVTEDSKIDFNASMAILLPDTYDRKVGSNGTFGCELEGKGHFKDSILYTLIPWNVLEQSFRLEDDSAQASITYTCFYDADNKASNWYWQYKNQKVTDLPECHTYCANAPPEDPAGLATMTWGGRSWGDSPLSYQCPDGTEANQGIQLIC